MLWSILKVIIFFICLIFTICFCFVFFSLCVGQVISQDFFSACVFFLFWFYLGLKLCLACQFTVHFEYSYFAHEIRFTQPQVIRVFGRPLTLNSVEVSVWHAFVNHEAFLVFHCFAAYCQLQPCVQWYQNINHTRIIASFLFSRLANPSMSSYLTATIRPLLFGKEITKNLFVVARSIAIH